MATRVITIIIPPNANAGDNLCFHVEGQELEFTVPEGSQPGDELQVEIGGFEEEEKEEDTIIDLGSSSRIKQLVLSSRRPSPDEERGDETNLVAWPAGISFAQCLSHFDLNQKRVLELGSGLGTCGLAAASLGAKFVLLTDIISALPSLEWNICRNELRDVVRAKPLVWGEDVEEEFDVVLGADLLYDSCSGYDNLIRTIASLKENPKIILAVRWRKPHLERCFFRQLERKGYEFSLFHTDILPCRLSWKEYGNNQCSESNDFFCQTEVSVGGGKEIVSLGNITEEHQERMNDEEYDFFERLQTQIYQGSRKS